MWFRHMSKKERGFYLLELQVSTAIIAILTAWCYQDLCNLLGFWHNTLIDAQLRDAGYYIQNILEKDLVYDSQQIILGSDAKGVRKLTCQTNHAGKSFTYTLERNGLYKQTKTTNTTGKNPLFVPDCQVNGWNVTKVGEETLYLQLILAKEGRSCTIEQYLKCLNGAVVDEG